MFENYSDRATEKTSPQHILKTAGKWPLSWINILDIWKLQARHQQRQILRQTPTEANPPLQFQHYKPFYQRGKSITLFFNLQPNDHQGQSASSLYNDSQMWKKKAFSFSAKQV